MAEKKTTTRPTPPAQKTTAARKPRAAAGTAPRARQTQRERTGPAAGRSAPLLDEVRAVKRMVQQLVAPPRRDDDALEASVDALRRVVSTLIEERMDAVIDDIVAVRREASALGAGGNRVVERLDQLLTTLGAVRFAAEPMDLVDPLIHSVVEERHTDGTPAGVVIETVRPGYRTVRGRVLCKAAVAVSRGA